MPSVRPPRFSLPPFVTSRPVIGMVHLAPLPGSPRYRGGIGAILDRAVRDVQALHDGGVDGLMFENFGDAPFFPGRVPPETVAGMTRILVELRPRVRLPFGVNVLRNDARAALGIAAAVGAAFVRVNVHIGAAVTDQGLLVGRAHETVRVRQTLAPGVRLWCDCRVKHSAPLAPRPLADEADDLCARGLADAVIVTGPATGRAAAEEDLEAVRGACPNVPVLVGSGMTPANLSLFLHADGFIVGTAFQARGRVDASRVRAFMRRVRALRNR